MLNFQHFAISHAETEELYSRDDTNPLRKRLNQLTHSKDNASLSSGDHSNSRMQIYGSPLTWF